MITPAGRHALVTWAALIATVACSSTPRRPEPVDDLALSEAVRATLREDERIDAGSIRVETRDGVVVLSGVVATLDEARRALRRAGRVRGVRQVVNRLRIVPLTTAT